MSARNAVIAAASVLVVALPLAACSSSGGSPAPSSSTPAPRVSLGEYSLLAQSVGESHLYAVSRGKAHGTKTVTLTRVARDGSDVDADVRVSETGTAVRTLTYSIDPNGGISIPGSARTLTSGDVERVAPIQLPTSAQLLSGKVFRESIPITITKTGGVYHLTDTVVLRSGGRKRVRVPAGTFDTVALSIQETLATGGHSEVTESVDYLAPHRGYVESRKVEYVDGKPQGDPIVETLVSVRRGTGTSLA